MVTNPPDAVNRSANKNPPFESTFLIINSLQVIIFATNKLPPIETSLPTNKRLFKETSPITVNRELKETSPPTNKRLFNETSPCPTVALTM